MITFQTHTMGSLQLVLLDARHILYPVVRGR